MHQNSFARFACLAAASLLAGCAASGSQYYSLQTLSAGAAAPVAHIDDAFNVHSVSIPAQVDRPQIVLTGRSGAQVSLLNESLWAAPLSDEIRQAVAGQLSQLLGVPDLDGAGVPAGLPLWNIRLTLHRFESVYGQQALLEASWRLARSPATPSVGAPVVCRATAVVPAAPGIDPLVVAHQRALAALSSMIAAQIEMGRKGQAVGSAAVPAAAASVVTLQGCSVATEG